MNYEEAQKILARAREGFPGTEAEINTALAHTGDVGPHASMRSSGVDQEVSPNDWRARVRERAIVVGGSKK